MTEHARIRANSEQWPDEGEWVLVFNVHGERGEVEAFYEKVAQLIDEEPIIYPEERFIAPVERT